METNTIDQSSSIESARSSLMSSIGNKTDFSQFKDDIAPSAPASSQVEDTTLNNPISDSRSESDASEQVNQTPSQPEKEGATNTSNEVATNPTDNHPVKRSDERKQQIQSNIQQLLNEKKQLEQEVNTLKTAKVEKPSDPAKPEYLIPQPTPPQYTKDVLSQLLQKAKADGDQVLFDNVQAQMEEWRQHEMKMIEWKIDHKEAVNRHNSTIEFYKQEALKKFETLKDPNSEHTQQYMGIRGWMQKEIPELLKKPVSEYLLAQISNWKLNSEKSSARLVATESELKKAKEEIEKLKKGSLPLDSSTRTEISSNTSSESATGDARSNLLNSIKRANLGFGSQTM